MKRGEVWDVDLDPTTGAEIRKTRPCVIVSRDSMARLPLHIVVPLTEWDDHFMRAAWHVQVQPTMGNGLQKISSADTFPARVPHAIDDEEGCFLSFCYRRIGGR